MHLRYLVPARDETTERDVDPMRVVGMDGRWYLEGWCHRAEDTRMFRMDRVEELTVLDVDGTPPAGARERDLSEGTFRPAPDDLVVTLRLLPGATWVADYYPVESTEDVPAAEGGGLLVRVRTADTAWLRRLVWRLGGRGIVLDPPEVVAEVSEGAASALRAYPRRRRGELTVLPWWGWLLFWVVLVLASVAFLGWRAWLVWGRTKVLGREVGRASALVAELEARADELREVEPTLIAVTQPTPGCGRSIGSSAPPRRPPGGPAVADRLPPWARVH